MPKQQKHLFFKSSGEMILGQQEINAFTFIDSGNILIANNRNIGIESLKNSGEKLTIKVNVEENVLKIVSNGDLHYCLFSTKMVVIDGDGKILSDMTLSHEAQDIHVMKNDKFIIRYKNNSIKAYKNIIE